jgi:hypothetical protein
MIPKELAEQVRTQVRGLKDTQAAFLQTYLRLCEQIGGARWRKDHSDVVSHQVRQEIVPIMEQAGMDHQSVQALCSWAERLAAKS